MSVLQTRRPGLTLGVTVGDPAGIGPEILAAALSDPSISKLATYRIYGRRQDLLDAAAALGEHGSLLSSLASAPPPSVSLVEVALPAGLSSERGQAEQRLEALEAGRFDPVRARIQVASLEQAADDAMAGRIDAVVTGPVNKSIFASAEDGSARYPGQSEFLAERTRATDWAMMLAGERLRVVLVTTHLAISRVADAIDGDTVERRARVALRFLRERLGIERPRLAVAALNPHAGDGGMFGDEEDRVLVPVVARLRAEGHLVDGPLPSDTLFARAARGGWDAVLAMYHDQGLIPLKLVDFGKAVNVTIGLPIVRTSPDHGVAYDIAGQGRADSGGMKAAIRLAVRLAGGPSS